MAFVLIPYRLGSSQRHPFPKQALEVHMHHCAPNLIEGDVLAVPVAQAYDEANHAPQSLALDELGPETKPSGRV